MAWPASKAKPEWVTRRPAPLGSQGGERGVGGLAARCSRQVGSREPPCRPVGLGGPFRSHTTLRSGNGTTLAAVASDCYAGAATLLRAASRRSSFVSRPVFWTLWALS